MYVSCLYELSCSALSHFACFPSSSLHFDRCAFTTAFSSALFVLICDIFVNCNWVATQWQYSTHLHTNSTQKDTKILEQCWTFTHKQYTEGQNNFGTVLDIYTQTVHRTIQKFWNSAGHLHTNSTQKNTKQTIHRTTQTFWNGAGHAPCLRVIPWHLPYSWGKSTEKPQWG